MTIALDLEIENHYEEIDTITTHVSVEVTEPEGDEGSDERSEWEWEQIMPHTGTGHTTGDSSYFVTVKASSRPDLIPAGTEYEFGT